MLYDLIERNDEDNEDNLLKRILKYSRQFPQHTINKNKFFDKHYYNIKKVAVSKLRRLGATIENSFLTHPNKQGLKFGASEKDEIDFLQKILSIKKSKRKRQHEKENRLTLDELTEKVWGIKEFRPKDRETIYQILEQNISQQVNIRITHEAIDKANYLAKSIVDIAGQNLERAFFLINTEEKQNKRDIAIRDVFGAFAQYIYHTQVNVHWDAKDKAKTEIKKKLNSVIIAYGHGHADFGNEHSPMDDSNVKNQIKELGWTTRISLKDKEDNDFEIPIFIFPSFIFNAYNDAPSCALAYNLTRYGEVRIIKKFDYEILRERNDISFNKKLLDTETIQNCFVGDTPLIEIYSERVDIPVEELLKKPEPEVEEYEVPDERKIIEDFKQSDECKDLERRAEESEEQLRLKTEELDRYRATHSHPDKDYDKILEEKTLLEGKVKEQGIKIKQLEEEVKLGYGEIQKSINDRFKQYEEKIDGLKQENKKLIVEYNKEKQEKERSEQENERLRRVSAKDRKKLESITVEYKEYKSIHPSKEDYDRLKRKYAGLVQSCERLIEKYERLLDTKQPISKREKAEPDKKERPYKTILEDRISKLCGHPYGKRITKLGQNLKQFYKTLSGESDEDKKVINRVKPYFSKGMDYLRNIIKKSGSYKSGKKLEEQVQEESRIEPKIITLPKKEIPEQPVSAEESLESRVKSKKPEESTKKEGDKERTPEKKQSWYNRHISTKIGLLAIAGTIFFGGITGIAYHKYKDVSQQLATTKQAVYVLNQKDKRLNQKYDDLLRKYKISESKMEDITQKYDQQTKDFEAYKSTHPHTDEEYKALKQSEQERKAKRIYRVELKGNLEKIARKKGIWGIGEHYGIKDNNKKIIGFIKDFAELNQLKFNDANNDGIGPDIWKKADLENGKFKINQYMVKKYNLNL